MTLTEKQSKHIKALLIDLKNHCSDREQVRPYISYFVIGDGLMEVKFQLFFDGELITRGSYSEILDYISETK
tara:strand:+ start:21 stop:236 length:216 start_codon:yes stop_codon:yes gene_type:complete